jgi:FG-GAP-like repeat
MRSLTLASLLTAGGLLTAPAGGTPLRLAYSSLELPGAPAQVSPVDVDDDPQLELAVVVVYTVWNELAVEESSAVDAVHGLVSVMTIVPALLERRELWIFDRPADGGTWRVLAPPLKLGTDVLSLEATGHPAVPLLALTDAGADAIRLSGGATPTLRREPLVKTPTALAGSGAFLPRLRWVHDLDGDAWPDLLLPVADGWRLYRGTAAGFAESPATVLAAPPFDDVETPWRRDLPLPEVRDVDGDGRTDIVVPHPTRGWEAFYVYRNAGRGAFAGPVGPLGGEGTVFFDDLDGDGRAEYVTQHEIELPDDAGLRREMGHARRPPQRYAVFETEADLAPRPTPRVELTVEGYAFADDSEVRLPGGLWDLDGDGRRDLVTLTLDFSMLQAVRVLVARSLSLGIDFHLFCQQADGSFRAVEGLDLSGHFHLDLDDFHQGELSLFSGDFDGDGRRDFLQIGRGDVVTVHRGGPGCRFPAEPDLRLELVDPPLDLALVDVADLDGDGLADLSVIAPRQPRDGRGGRGGRGSPVRLDLYLSGPRP